MPVFRDMSIGRKITVIILTTSVLKLLLVCAAIGAYDIHIFRQTMELDMATLADVIAGNSTAALTFHDTRAAQDVLSALRAEPHITAACIYGQDGIPFATYRRDQKGSLRSSSPLPCGTYLDRDIWRSSGPSGWRESRSGSFIWNPILTKCAPGCAAMPWSSGWCC